MICHLRIAFRDMIVLPARTLIERLNGYRIPGGLWLTRGRRYPRLCFVLRSACGVPRTRAPGATAGRPPAADFPGVVDGWHGVSRVHCFPFGLGVSRLRSLFAIEWSEDCLRGLGFVVSRHCPRGTRACRRQASGSDPMQTECGAKRRTKCSVGLRAPSNNESPPDGGRMNNTVNK